MNAPAERELDAKWNIDTSSIPPALADQLLAKASVSVTIYEAYETGLANDAEFTGAAADFAKTYGSLGIAGAAKGPATVALGVPIAIHDRGDLSQVIVTMHRTLRRLADGKRERLKAGSADGVAPDVPEPQIQSIAIFAHGVRKALGLDPQGATGGGWMGIDRIPAFVNAIKGSVPGNVNFLLFACSAGAGETEKPGMPTADSAGGEGSFAAALANALGGTAVVFAHNVGGHAESNAHARSFSAGSPTGRDMFNVMYDAAFITSERTRVKQSSAPVVEGTSDSDLEVGLRAAMWEHFDDAIAADFGRIRTKSRHFAVGGYGGVGAAMFMDPTGTASLLHGDFQTVWMTAARIAKLRKVSAPPTGDEPSKVARWPDTGETVGLRVLQRNLPGADRNSGVIGASPAAQLGDFYDIAQQPPVDVVSGGGAPTPGGIPAAMGLLQGLWIMDMFTALQILRINGSTRAPRSRAPFEWLISNRAAAAPRLRLVLTAISHPEAVVEADFAGLPADQVREVKAFMALRSWDDPVAGLPRTASPASPLTPAQRDMLEYIRRRRAAATTISGAMTVPGGVMYMGKPSEDPTPTGAQPGSLDAEIWKELDLEGSASAINTYDDQLFTWGKGWSAKTTLPAIADAFFAADPGAKNELLEAGFTHTGGKWLFVSLTEERVLEDNAALSAFRGDIKFSSLVAHLVEDPAHQQQMVNAQWSALSTGGHAGDVPRTIRQAWPGGWSTAAVRFGAHCVHWGRSWGEVERNGPAIATLLPWIARLKGTVDPSGAVIVRGWSSHTIRHFANHVAHDLMAGPDPLPVPPAQGTFYFQMDGKGNELLFHHWSP